MVLHTQAFFETGVCHTEGLALVEMVSAVTEIEFLPYVQLEIRSGRDLSEPQLGLLDVERV
jgi:hypothetical protein